MASNRLSSTTVPRVVLSSLVASIPLLSGSTALAAPADPEASVAMEPPREGPEGHETAAGLVPDDAVLTPSPFVETVPDAEATTSVVPAGVVPASTVPTSAVPTTFSPAPATVPPAEEPGPNPVDAALAAARMVGVETRDAGVYFGTYAATLGVMSAFYGSSNPGIVLGLAVGGLVNAGVGAALLTAGTRRMNANDAWLDAKPGRRARFEAKARKRNLSGLPEQFGGASKAIVQRGMQRRASGVGTLIAGGVLNGVAVGVSPVAPGVGLGLNIVGWAAVATGAVLAARGKKMMFRPYEHGGERMPLAIAPTVIGGAEGRRVPGLSLAGRW